MIRQNWQGTGTTCSKWHNSGLRELPYPARAGRSRKEQEAELSFHLHDFTMRALGWEFILFIRTLWPESVIEDLTCCNDD